MLTLIKTYEYSHRDEVIKVYQLPGETVRVKLLEHHRNKKNLTGYWVNQEFDLTPESVAITYNTKTGAELTRWYSYNTTLKNGKPVDVTRYSYGWFFHKKGVSKGVWATLSTDQADKITEIENQI